MSWIEEKAIEVRKQYRTNNVYELCALLNIPIIPQALGLKNSMIVTKNGKSVISVRPDAERWLKAYFIGHELGHYFCHEGIDPDLDDSISLPNKEKMEKEADTFSLSLLFIDEENVMSKGGTIESFCNATGLPQDLFREWRNVYQEPYND